MTRAAAAKATEAADAVRDWLRGQPPPAVFPVADRRIGRRAIRMPAGPTRHAARRRRGRNQSPRTVRSMP
jgi:hypothetical protein